MAELSVPEKTTLQEIMDHACSIIRLKIFKHRCELNLGIGSKTGNVNVTDFKIDVNAKVHLEVCGANFNFELHYPEVPQA
jgi:hypothetical protein